MLSQIGLFIIATFVLMSCTWKKSSPLAETVRIASPTVIASFDPIHASDDPASQTLQLFYEPLLKITQDGQAWPKTEAAALESLPSVSQDGTEIRLQLKKGLRFQASPEIKLEAREATSMDLAVTLLRNGDRSLNPRYADTVEAIEGVTDWFKQGKNLDQLPSGIKVIDPLTLTLKLKKAEPGWWYNLSAINFSLVPREAFGRSLIQATGTGSYVVKVNSSELLSLEKVSGPGPKKIEYVIYNNQADETLKLVDSNKVDLLPVAPELTGTWLNGNLILEKDAKAGKEVVLSPNNQYVGLILHPKLNPKMKEDLHRRLNQNLDRAAVAGSLGPLLTSCNSLYRCDSELPASTKYKGKDLLKARVFVNPNESEALVQKNLSAALREAGIEATFVKGDWPSSKEWTADLALVDIRMTSYDPADLLALGNASADLKQKMISTVSGPTPSASDLDRLSVWVRDESDLVIIARRQAALIVPKGTEKVAMDIHGWLDPRTIEKMPQGPQSK